MVMQVEYKNVNMESNEIVKGAGFNSWIRNKIGGGKMMVYPFKHSDTMQCNKKVMQTS